MVFRLQCKHNTIMHTIMHLPEVNSKIFNCLLFVNNLVSLKNKKKFPLIESFYRYRQLTQLSSIQLNFALSLVQFVYIENLFWFLKLI